MKDFIPVAKVELSDAEIEAAVEVLKSGRLSQGSRTEEFEKAFAEKVGSKYAIAVSSGTAALHVAYLCVLNRGDEVLVPSFSHISTASMAYFAGCRPVFCDIDPKTFTLSIEDARKRLTGKTRGIAPVHIFGNACDVDEIVDFAAEHDLLIIWDAAQAHGTKFKGKDVGSLDDMVCYSFYPTKNMLTGEGGMITTNNGELAEKCRLLRSHWQTSKYHHPGLGFNYRMTELEAAIGLEQLNRLEQFVQKRRYNAAFLTEGLAEVDAFVTPFVKEGVEHSFHQYAILLELEKLNYTRDEFAKRLEKAGIGTGIHYPRPLHKQLAFEKMLGNICLPVSESICDRILSLPVYPQLKEEELSKIVEELKKLSHEAGIG